VNGTGSAARKAATAAATNHHASGVANTIACGASAAWDSAGQNTECIAPARSSSAFDSDASGIDATAINTSGTKRKPMSGIAIRFTPIPATDTLPNQARVAGASSSATATCTCSASLRLPPERPIDAVDTMIAVIATNDSQNPDASTANGSSASTRSSATASGWAGGAWRSSARAAYHAPSMSNVRCVGTEKPARSA
jgi:hypothetical protein